MRYISVNFFSLLQTFILVIALSTDAFVASFAYGANKIKIPLSSASIINLICTAFVMLSVLLSSIIRPWISEDTASAICFSILFLLGLFKLFDSSLKHWISKRKEHYGKLSFKLFDLKFILHVYADPAAADSDESRTLSVSESVSLAVALSLDGLSVGFGAGLSDVNYIELGVAAFTANFVSIIFGCFLGNKLSLKTNISLSWLGGVLLIVLAILKLK